MMRFTTLLMLVLTLFSCETAPQKKKTSKKKTHPKLVVGIVVDQMRYDYLTRFESKYGDKGFKKLMKKGFHCDEHHFSYMPTATGPGHASVFTGTTPETHGIISNNWYDKQNKRILYCVEDTTVKSVGVNDADERRSPKNIMVTGLGDQIKMATSYRGKTVGVSIKDRAAILPAGKMADAAYWYVGGTEGKFISSTYYMNSLPQWADDFNALNKPKEYLSHNWETLLPIEQYTEANPDNNDYEVGFESGVDPVFPYDLKRISKAKGLSLIKSTPFGNDLLIDFAKAAIEGEHLGQDDNMDLLTVSFSSPDYIGHNFGPRSVEVEDTYLRLDKSLADFLDYLDRTVGKGEYVIFLTADHGVAQVPHELMDQGVEVGYYSDSVIQATVNESLNAKFGVADLIDNFSSYQFFLNRTAIKKHHLNMDEVCQTIVDAAMTVPGVKSGMTRSDLERNQFDDRVKRTVQKGWNHQRSGDVAIIIAPGWLSNGYEGGGTGHGSPWAYDTHVPLLFYGFGVSPGSTNTKTWVEDIVPTVAAVIGVQPPMGATGKAIDEVLF